MILLRDGITYIFSIVEWILLYPFRITRTIYFESEDLFKYRGNMLIASNHKGIFDPWVLFSSLPFSCVSRISPFKILAKPISSLPPSNSLEVILLKLKMIDVVYWIHQCILVRPVGDTREKLVDFQTEIDLKNTVLMFPEGKISSTESLGLIKKGISILREDNPNLPFLFVSIKYKKTKIPFIHKTAVSFSKLSLENPEDYSQYVADYLNLLSSKLE
jgi:1-acyl-sn-glycerol-3-phosphate acyltransferase